VLGSRELSRSPQVAAGVSRTMRNPRRLSSELAILFQAITCLACGSHTVKWLSPSPPHAIRVINVSRPMVVKFFPTVAEGDEHLPFALEDTASCLRQRPVTVMAVQADVLVFRDGAQEFRLELSDDLNESTGCLLVAPNRSPMIMRATMGGSSLVAHCPSAASIYFDEPACCPKGVYCCPDGAVAGEQKYCDG
jgi:hypothetical protein